MEQLIPITNQIRDALASVESLDFAVELPQIAVVGGQSAGKSSLLEGLVGHAFLPTGRGVVTRRPLLLRLANTSGRRPRDGEAEEWGEFHHLPSNRFEDFDAIRAEIEKDTERICGQKQGVSSEPIILKISSPRVIDLTLIDLPGMTRVPVGDQPEDIETQIRELIMTYIRRPSCLILAVVPGNADLATSDALAVARLVDPEGQRTIGVVTKLDLVDTGIDSILPILQGSVYPLRLGFIGVVCRSFHDVQKGKELREHLATETHFFQGNPAYRSLANRCGIEHLAKHLNRILVRHIHDAMPRIRSQVLHLIHENEVELQACGDTVSLQRGEQGALLLGLLTKFAGRFADAIEGKMSNGADLPPGQLVGRARIDYIFRDVFAKTVTEFGCCNGLSDEEIRVAIRNATGPRATLFVPEAAFELLARKQISKLLSPSLQCAELVFDELQRVLLLSDLPELRRFTQLRDQIFAVVRDILRSAQEPCLQMIRDLVSLELAYINTNHPDFVGSSGAMRAAVPMGEQAKVQRQNSAPSCTRVGGVNGVASQAQAVERSSQISPRQDSGGTSSGGGFFGFFRSLAGESRQMSSEQIAAEPPSVSAQAQAPGELSSASLATLHPARGAGAGGGWGGKLLSGATPILEETAGNNHGRLIAQDGLSKGSFIAVPCCGSSSESLSMQGSAAFTRTLTGTSGTLMKPSGSGSSCHASAASGLKLPYVPPVITPATTAPSQRERVEVNIIKMLLESYLTIVKKTMADSVPKAVMHFMVNRLKDVIQSECVARLYKEERFGELLREASDMQGRRTRCRERLEALHKVIEVTEQVRELADLW